MKTASNGYKIVSSKLLTVRATTRDLLLGLINDGQIPGPLAGWKVVARCNDRDVSNANYSLFAVKRGQTPVELKEPATGNPIMVLSPIGSGPFVIKARVRGEDVISATGSSQLYLSGTLFLSPASFIFSGLANQPFTVARRTVEGVTSSTSVPGTVKVPVSGLGYFEAESGPVFFSTRGSLSFGPHRITASYLY